MKKILIFFVFCLTPALFSLGATDSQQVLEKLDSLEKTVSDLSLRILVLEKRIISLEEKIFLAATSLEAAKAEKQPESIGEKPPKESLGNFEPSGYDFSIESVVYETDYNDTVFKGAIINNSNNDFRYALFKITVYGKNGSVLTSNDFYILNMDRGTTRTFEAKIHGVKKGEFDRYTIEFTKGS